MKKLIVTATVISIFASPFFITSAAASNRVQSQPALATDLEIDWSSSELSRDEPFALQAPRYKDGQRMQYYRKPARQKRASGFHISFTGVLLPEATLD